VVGATLPIFVDYPSGQKAPAEPIRWTMNDGSLATIRPKGHSHEIVGLRPGTVKVRATQGPHECIETLHVVDPEVVESVGLELDDANAQAPNRFQLVAKAFYAYRCWQVITADAALAWSSSDESIARLAPSGVVLGQKDGDARISIAFKGRSAHLDVHIENGVLATLSENPFHESFARVHVTTSIFLFFWATVRDWRPRAGAATLSAEPRGMVELAQVGDTWTIRGLRAGTAVVTVRLGTLRAKKTIDVREPRNPRFGPITVEAADDRSSLNLLFIDQESAAYVSLTDDHGSIDNCHDITWSSSAPEVLSVLAGKEGSANVKALAVGNVILKVECKALGVSQERALRVAEQPNIEWF
jgi:hypothetical protein